MSEKGLPRYDDRTGKSYGGSSPNNDGNPLDLAPFDSTGIRRWKDHTHPWSCPGLIQIQPELEAPFSRSPVTRCPPGLDTCILTSPLEQSIRTLIKRRCIGKARCRKQLLSTSHDGTYAYRQYRFLCIYQKWVYPSLITTCRKKTCTRFLHLYVK